VLDRTPNSVRDVSAVTVEVFAGGVLYMRYDPAPYITVSSRSFQTTRDIERGEILSSGDVQEMWIDVRQLPSDDPYENIEDIIGLAARTNIQAGHTITENMLELPTLVIRGETVIVSVPFGNAAITLRGIALDSGSLGEEIRVRNPDSNTIISATVSGQSHAEIRLLN
jgi:flagellar basal body P-ring formation protein FlgA